MPNEISATINALVSRPAQVARTQTPESGVSSVERQTLPQSGKHVPQPGLNSETKREDLDEAVSRIQDYVQNLHRELQFTVDEESGRTIIKVIDSETERVIRQIPPDELIAISEYIQSSSGGVLLKVQA